LFELFKKSLIWGVVVLASLIDPQRAEAVGELIELLLSPRSVVDQPLVPGPGGVFTVDVDEPFFLEVSYDDLRVFGNDLGAFALYADIVFSDADVLEPILTETQRVIIGEEVTQATSGSLFIGLEGSVVSYEAALADLANDAIGEIANALTAFGYTPEQYAITTFATGSPDLGYQIRYLGDDFADIDLPDPLLSPNFDVAVPTQLQEFTPRNPDSSINGEAVRFNLDTRSRTFNDNEDFYENLTRGGFDPVEGFTDVGGVGQVAPGGGGIPELSEDGILIEPFDAYSLRVRFIQPVTSFVADVVPGAAPEAILLYGDVSPLPPSMVLLDEGASVEFIAVPEPGGDLLSAMAIVVTLMCTAQRRHVRCAST